MEPAAEHVDGDVAVRLHPFESSSELLTCGGVLCLRSVEQIKKDDADVFRASLIAVGEDSWWQGGGLRVGRGGRSECGDGLWLAVVGEDEIVFREVEGLAALCFDDYADLHQLRVDSDRVLRPRKEAGEQGQQHEFLFCQDYSELEMHELVKPSQNGICHGKMANMDDKILTIDKAGRIVLPKPLREKLSLAPGTELKVNIGVDDSITLSPVRKLPVLRKKKGIWVYYGESKETPPIAEWLDKERERRIAETLPK